jgi:lipopolysaccharide biosynthesis protein
MEDGADDAPVDAFAYYLPQFYPMALNSKWWGEGFTEWVSVVRAHRGWRSPRGTTLTPGELGFYDLRDVRTRARQGELARAAGLAAFCVYHYWSAGHRLLPEVEDALLDDGQPDIPFFLGWANHHWTLMWQGRGDIVTHEQRYDEHENDDHITWLLDVMRDPRYYRIGNAPVLLVYDPLSVPSHEHVFRHWRELAAARGHDLVLLGATRGVPDGTPEDHGLDAWVEGTAHVFTADGRWSRAAHSLTTPLRAARFAAFRDVFWSYDDLCRRFERSLSQFSGTTVPLVLTGWNNLGRRARRGSCTDSTPKAFADAVRRAAAVAPAVGTGRNTRRLVAINAWNEWGEGMTMEPSTEWESQYVEALRAALGQRIPSAARARQR